ncbi:hypothetical protein XELAEV_18024097mg [Xenopus laevis]|uniref:Uncharacterized protein n=1 Tax=Xenopus laevis TaxID=8355 RepID=A0A974D7U9_XENLA|nr:hypothetical protein XELAEV_18024097mg [Xenopus laevis]
MKKIPPSVLAHVKRHYNRRIVLPTQLKFVCLLENTSGIDVGFFCFYRRNCSLADGVALFNPYYFPFGFLQPFLPFLIFNASLWQPPRTIIRHL